ncbi:MAG: hypothetical protein JW791_01325 [Nanoarchaeota archaeon]|nr:hypothetical protein [Nanoarchaeota archaeon]
MSLRDLEAKLEESLVEISAKRGKFELKYKIVSDEYFNLWLDVYNTLKDDESFRSFTMLNSSVIFGFNPERFKYQNEMFGDPLKII